MRSRRAGGLALGGAVLALGVAGLQGRLHRYAIVEGSMKPALNPGDYVVAAAAGKPTRGDIVVYPHPATSDQSLVKRIVGLGGEEVAVSGGQVAVNGELLAEPWADGPTHPDGNWPIPPGTVFLLGDNRRLSSGDSRSTGPVRTDDMYKVIWRYWPLRTAGRV